MLGGTSNKVEKIKTSSIKTEYKIGKIYYRINRCRSYFFLFVVELQLLIYATLFTLECHFESKLKHAGAWGL